MKKYFKLFIKIFVSTALIVFLVNTVDLSVLVSNINSMHYQYIPVILLLLICNYIVSSVRWRMLLIWEDIKPVSVLYLTKLYFIGSFFNNFMPTSIGGDVYKIFRLGKKLDNNYYAFSSTFMERFTGVIALVIISLFAGIKLYGLLGLMVFILFWIGLFIGFKLFILVAPKIKKLNQIKDALIAYKDNKQVLIYAMLLSFLVQVFAVLTQYFVFLALGVPVSLLYAFLFLPFITLASFVIPSLNGLGVQDSLYISLFGLVGVVSESALSVSVMYHLFRLAISLIGGIWYAIDKD